MSEARNRLIDDALHALAGIRFPATKEEILEQKATQHLKLGEGRSMTLRDALTPVNTERFHTREELLEAVGRTHGADWLHR